MIIYNALATGLITIIIIIVYSLNFNPDYHRDTRRDDYIEPYLLFEAILGMVKLGDLVYMQGQWPYRKLNYLKEFKSKQMMF